MKKKVTIQLEDYILEKAQRRAEQLGVSLSSYFSMLAAINTAESLDSWWARNGMRPYCAGEPIDTGRRPNLASGTGAPPAVPSVTATSASHAFVVLDSSKLFANECRDLCSNEGKGPLGTNVTYFG